MDKLSDYIPASNEISRVPSRQESASIEEVESEIEEEEDDEEKDDDDDDDDDGDDADGDATMGGAKPKTPGELRRMEDSKQRRAKLDEKKENKKNLDTVVCCALQTMNNATDTRNQQHASRKATQATNKSTDSIKRFSYLLGQTDLFRHFCDLKVRWLRPTHSNHGPVH